ncbi:hypothetical protein HK099_000696 [Clydaea vesicula]|uniref:Uncharacterized protein n=1 Tax=Clydaea vesicula TaxID=447962 RepID=A0AAD5TUQ7_9FUNG|nr:hypothetical protein HK099_000696 [Clydaea vesicula]KAJ3380499.1 hypothetical protein HDU92_005942 [Lobulomyces angularis]
MDGPSNSNNVRDLFSEQTMSEEASSTRLKQQSIFGSNFFSSPTVAQILIWIVIGVGFVFFILLHVLIVKKFLHLKKLRNNKEGEEDKSVEDEWEKEQLALNKRLENVKRKSDLNNLQVEVNE